MDELETHIGEAAERRAAELYRQVGQLNHATLGRTGLVRPGAAYSVLGNLAQTAFGLAQAIEQIDAFLDRELAAGRLGHDSGLDPTPVIVQAHDALARAHEQTLELGESFRRAQGALTAVHSTVDERDVPEMVESTEVGSTAPDIEPAKNDFPAPIKEALAGQDQTGAPPSQRPSAPLPSRPRRER